MDVIDLYCTYLTTLSTNRYLSCHWREGAQIPKSETELLDFLVNKL